MSQVFFILFMSFTKSVKEALQPKERIVCCDLTVSENIPNMRNRD